MILVLMIETFGDIYARVLDESGVRLDRGTYITTEALIDQMKCYGDPSIKDYADSKLRHIVIANRMQSASTKVEDVRFSNGRCGASRWSFNPFSMLFSTYSDFHKYRDKLRRAKKVHTSGEDIQGLAALSEKLTPRRIIGDRQAVYRLMMGIPKELFDDLIAIADCHGSYKPKKLPRMVEVYTCLKKAFSDERSWIDDVPKKKRSRTKRLVNGLAECLPGKEGLDHFYNIGCALKLARKKPGWKKEFLAQAEQIIQTDINQVPTEWSESSLTKEAVTNEYVNLLERAEWSERIKR